MPLRGGIASVSTLEGTSNEDAQRIDNLLTKVEQAMEARMTNVGLRAHQSTLLRSPNLIAVLDPSRLSLAWSQASGLQEFVTGTGHAGNFP